MHSSNGSEHKQLVWPKQIRRQAFPTSAHFHPLPGLSGSPRPIKVGLKIKVESRGTQESQPDPQVSLLFKPQRRKAAPQNHIVGCRHFADGRCPECNACHWCEAWKYFGLIPDLNICLASLGIETRNGASPRLFWWCPKVANAKSTSSTHTRIGTAAMVSHRPAEMKESYTPRWSWRGSVPFREAYVAEWTSLDQSGTWHLSSQGPEPSCQSRCVLALSKREAMQKSLVFPPT